MLGPSELDRLMLDFLATDPELTSQFAIRASGTNVVHTRAAAGVVAQAVPYRAQDLEPILRQIRAVEASIARINQAQTHHLRTAAEVPADFNLRWIQPADGTTWASGQTRDQLIALAEAYKQTLQRRHAAVQKELQNAQSNLRNSGADFRETAAQFEFMAHQRMRVVVKQLDDAQADLDYLRTAAGFNHEDDREMIVERKQAVLNDALEVLRMQLRFEKGEDPRRRA
jgi:hypothetical protein